MAIRLVRLGSPRASREALRLGTVRHPPRGVPRKEYAARGHFDLWLPELAPAASLLAWFRSGPPTDVRWQTFRRRYQAQMRRPPASRLIALLAAFSSRQNLSVGCYCEDASRCHRVLLGELLHEQGAVVKPG